MRTPRSLATIAPSPFRTSQTGRCRSADANLRDRHRAGANIPFLERPRQTCPWNISYVGYLLYRGSGQAPSAPCVLREEGATHTVGLRAASLCAASRRALRLQASWDRALALAMREHGIAIAEEALATSLLHDLDDR
ncbi:DUF2399 domain-containing protein [Mesorhizobium sp. B2-3-12]|uniref:DUF2399 domain-containing protein n=1 Tax=Mesorhizobium sp. B2-3-12 TaxID=2589952 RepID=UPI00112B0252|nr:DUF2399 domain-containing protein [Mesorhizobium sp. B2-3-12]TPL85073.1 DUF2399 domain-containing protein [Mesorhizobium sp. B2-3-12]